MNSSRAALIGMLIAAEILIAGLAIWSIGGAGHLSASGFSTQHVDYSAKTVGTFDAGVAPHVTISDPDSRVVVNISPDNRVHVKDLTDIHGFFSSSAPVPPLRAHLIAGGVAVERDAYHHDFVVFGESKREIEVDVPTDTFLEILQATSADVTGVHGGATVRAGDGHITLADVQGKIDAHTADGNVTASNVRGDSVSLQTADGHMRLNGIDAAALIVRSEDGRIDASQIRVSGGSPTATLHSDDGSVHVNGTFAPGGTYEISSNDGHVDVTVPSNSDLTIAASTADGSVVVDGKSNDDNDKAQTIKLGSGSGTMRVSSQDGSINLMTNGAL